MDGDGHRAIELRWRALVLLLGLIKSEALAGVTARRYQFGHTFYAPDAVATVSIDRGEVVLTYDNVTTTLVPLADGSYLDRLYWSFIRFAGATLVYRNGSSEFTAPRLR